MNIIESLQWRYATKAFDATQKLSQHEVDTILEAGRLAPSSYGLEPWKFIVVENEAVRARLKEVSWNQSQVTDASHFVVLATQKAMTAEDIDAFIARIASVRGVDVANLASYADLMKNSVLPRSAEDILAWNKRQTYIALGLMLETAALMGVDTCPMEGFDPQAYDDILGLSESGYTATVVLPLGKRHTTDSYATLEKVRKPKEEVIQIIA